MDWAAALAATGLPEPGQLNHREIFWRDHQVWLQEKGFMLRPRYRPGWIPSWHLKNRLLLDCEDGTPLVPGVAIDAIRIRDKTDVILKQVETVLEEHIIAQRVSSPKDPQNHCVPILEVFEVPNSKYHIIVMPLLRSFLVPRFDTIGEAVDFFGQIFEGVKYLHDRNIAHRDCNAANIMMEASKMYPDGFHFQHPKHTRDYSRFARFYPRTRRPPRYYLIDFGLTRIYDTRDPPPIEPIIPGGDRSVPEFKTTDENGPMACDPFPIDVYYLGNMIKKHFLDGDDGDPDGDRMLGFEFMRPLANDMTAQDPAKRPDMSEVVERFTKIRKSLSWWKLRSHVAKAKDSPYNVFRLARHWYLWTEYILRRMPAIPNPPSE
ncbi:kinase-like domain-containing protein [Mycena belliarum]|uniref:Kinase-like domain-containing protein n=1 Tax=Mycena belliarum TaxID=1033014 RepID=A0AAD6UBK7_9AGAR|nr:kinase-like domain-containing protein [Mycena belliae]